MIIKIDKPYHKFVGRVYILSKWCKAEAGKVSRGPITSQILVKPMQFSLSLGLKLSHFQQENNMRNPPPVFDTIMQCNVCQVLRSQQNKDTQISVDSEHCFTNPQGSISQNMNSGGNEEKVSTEREGVVVFSAMFVAGERRTALLNRVTETGKQKEGERRELSSTAGG